MCRPTQPPSSTSTSSNSEDFQLQQDEQQQQQQKPGPAKKQVHFAEFYTQVQTFDNDLTETERQQVWMTNDDYRRNRMDINATVRVTALGGLSPEEQLETDYDTEMYCFRGLEFMKQIDGSPSRKERRLKYMKDVVLHYRCLLKKVQHEPTQLSLQLGAFCTHLSKDATCRAQELANGDYLEARIVYQESHFIYENEYGQEVQMFSSSSPSKSTSSLCTSTTTTTTTCREVYSTEQQQLFMTMSYDMFSPLLRLILPCAV